MLSPRAVYINSLLISGFVAWVVWFAVTSPDTGSHLYEMVQKAYWSFHGEYMDDILNPWFYAAFGLVIALQGVLPALRTNQYRNASTALDFFYMFFRTPFYLLITLPYLGYLKYLYDNVLHGPVLEPVQGVPDMLVVLAVFVFGDFIGWFHHVLRHKIAAIWQFHAVHHSTRHFNIFSRYRFHAIDLIFSSHIRFLPLMFFHQLLGEAVMLYMFKLVIDLLAHSNVRANYGPLRYIFVTPQSHRIHHSNLPEHIDKNFGVSLSIWDYIFGTQYRKYDEYPETGIVDVDYPVEQNARPSVVLKTFLRQVIYPFQVVFQGNRDREVRELPVAPAE